MEEYGETEIYTPNIEVGVDVYTEQQSDTAPYYKGEAKLYVKPLSVRLFIFAVIIILTFCLSFGIFLVLDMVKGANVVELMYVGLILGGIFAVTNFLVIERSRLLLMDDRIIVYRTCRTCDTYLLEDFSRVYTKRIYNGGHYIGKTQFVCFKRCRNGKVYGERKLNLSFLRNEDVTDLINRIYLKCRPHVTEKYGIVDKQGYVNQAFRFVRSGLFTRTRQLKNRITVLVTVLTLLLIAVPAYVCKFFAGGSQRDVMLMAVIGAVLGVLVLIRANSVVKYYDKVIVRSPNEIEIKKRSILINNEKLINKEDIKYVDVSDGPGDGTIGVQIRTLSGMVKIYFDKSEEPDKSETIHMLRTLEYWCDINQITYSGGDVE